MADEVYDIVVNDKIPTTVATKLNAIGKSAQDASASLQVLQRDLANIDASKLTASTAAFSRQSSAQATLAQTATQAATAQAKLDLAQNQSAAAAAKNQLAQIALANAIKAQNAAQLASISSSSSVTSAAEKVAGDIGKAGGAAKINASALRELFVIPREIGEGRSPGYLTGSISLLLQRLGLLTPATLPVIAAFAAVAGVGALVAASFIAQDQSNDRLNASTLGLGQSLGLTAAQFESNAVKIGESADISTNAAEKLQIGLVRAGAGGTIAFANLGQNIQKFADITGTSAADATKQFGQAFADPTKGATDLNKSLGGLDAQTLATITTFQNQGNIVAAQNALYAYFVQRISAARTSTQQWNGDLVGLTTTIENLFKALPKLFAVPDAVENARMYGGTAANNPIVAAADTADRLAKQVAQAKADKDKLSAQTLALNTVDQGTSAGGKRTQIDTLTANKTIANDIINSAISTPEQRADAKRDLQDINGEIAKLNKTPAAPRNHEIDVFTESLRKLNDESKTFGLVGDNLDIQKQFNQISEQAAKGKTGGALTSSQQAALRSVLETAQHQKDVQTQLNAVYNQAVKPLEDYKDMIEAIDLALQKQIITSQQAAALTVAASIKEKTRTQLGYDPSYDPDVLAKTDLKSQLELQSELTQARQVDTQVEADKLAAIKAGNTYTANDVVLLRNRLTLEQQVSKVVSARDSIEQSSLTYKTQQLLIQRTALEQLENNPKANLDKYTDRTENQKLNASQLDLGEANGSGETQSVFSASQGQQLNTLENQLKATNALFKDGALSVNEYGQDINKINLAKLDNALAGGQGGVKGSFIDGLAHSVQNFKGILPGLSDSFNSFFSSLESGFGDTVGKIVTGQETLKQGFQQLAQSAISDLISSLVKLGVQFLVTQAVGQSLGAAASAAAIAEAAAISAAWQPAALAASIATLGGADATGAAAYTAAQATIGLNSALSAIGLASGGPVSGPGGPMDDKAGLFALSHGEYVVNARATAANFALIDYINKGGKIGHRAQGGSVGYMPTMQAGPTSHSSSNSTMFNFAGATFGAGYSRQQAMQDFNDAYEAKEPQTIAKSRVASGADLKRTVRRPSLNGSALTK